MDSEQWFYIGPEIIAWTVILLYIFASILAILNYILKKPHGKMAKTALIAFATVLLFESGLYLFEDHLLARLNNLEQPFSSIYFVLGWFGFFYLLKSTFMWLEKEPPNHSL